MIGNVPDPPHRRYADASGGEPGRAAAGDPYNAIGGERLELHYRQFRVQSWDVAPLDGSGTHDTP